MLLSLFLIATVSGCGEKDHVLKPVIYASYDSDSDWSPDGKSVIFIRVGNSLEGRKSAILRYDVADSSLSTLYLTDAADIICPRYSPDGTKILFSQFGDLFMLDLENDSVSQITFKGDIYYPDWNPDGRRIAYHDFHGEERGVYIMDLETGASRRFPDYSERPVWFPGGNTLAIISFNYGRDPQIARVDTLGNILQKLTDTPTYKYHIDINMKSAKICFSQDYSEGVVRLWTMGSNGSNLKRLINEDSDFPAYSPDGEWIVYTRLKYDDGSLWAIRADGSDRHRLTDFNADIYQQ